MAVRWKHGLLQTIPPSRPSPATPQVHGFASEKNFFNPKLFKCGRISPSSQSSDDSTTSLNQEKLSCTNCKSKWKICKHSRVVFVVLHMLGCQIIFGLYECRLLERNWNAETMEQIFISVSVALQLLSMILMAFVINVEPGVRPKPDLQQQEINAEYYNTHRKSAEIVTCPIEYNGTQIVGTYCFYCRHFRPPETSHCRFCDRCIDRYDHHCEILETCIGIRNFKYYFFFCLITSVFYLFVLIVSLYRLFEGLLNSNNVLTTLTHVPVTWYTTLSIILLIIFGWGQIMCFTCAYIYLTGRGETAHNLYFVLETQKTCKCHTVLREHRENFNSNTTTKGCSLLWQNYYTFLFKRSPPSLIKN